MLWFDCIRLAVSRPLWISFILGSMALAQGATPAPTPVPAPTPEPSANAPQAPQQPAPVAEIKAPASSNALGTILLDGSKVRCWPTGHSPTYDDAFAKGATVGIGRGEGGFRQVMLPLGPVGYVHKKFAGEMKDGKVATTGKAVAFRYRPKSGEPPVTSLAEGAELWVLGEQDEWWRVRNAAAECWLPEADVQVFDPAPETMTKAFAELQKTQMAEVQAYIAVIAQRKEEARLELERQKTLLTLQEQLGAELKKPAGQQSLDTVQKSVAEFLAQLPENSVARPGTVELQKRIATQKWVAEATAIRDTAPVPVKDLPKPRQEVADPLERFQAVGFLRWEKGLTGPGQYVVEKGGQRLYLATCTSGRYDLSLFVGKEVGMIGSRRRPSSDSLRVIDVDKIEVLAANFR